MSRVILEGGTDVGEMALFSVDELPKTADSRDALAELEERNQAVRLPTGGDGGYLLHLLIDESLPDELGEHCVDDDTITADFQTESGNIAFGGAESAFSNYAPNPNIRSDATIAPGAYRATAYRTEYPGEVIDDAIEQAVGAEGARTLDFAGTIIMIVVGLVLVLPILMIVLFQSPAIAIFSAIASIVGGVAWYRTYTGKKEFKELSQRSEDAQRQFPSIVIRLETRSQVSSSAAQPSTMRDRI